MSNFTQQEKHANSLALWFCVECQRNAISLAWAVIRDNNLFPQSYRIVSDALELLNAGEIQPCQHDCANSGAMVTMRKIAEQVEDLDEPEQHKYQADTYADWSEEICSRCGDMRYAHKK